MSNKPSRSQVAIASCSAFPELTSDDLLLQDALRELGINPVPVVWDDESVDWSSFDACLIRSVWDYHFKYDDFVSWVDQLNKSIRVWNQVELMMWNTDKSYLRTLDESGIPTIPTVWLEQGTEVRLDEVLGSVGWKDAIIKPTVDLGAQQLRRVQSVTSDDQKALDALLEKHSVMVQPFLSSVEEKGEKSLVYLGGELTHVILKRPQKGDFRVQPGWGGTSTRSAPTAAEHALANRVLDCLDSSALYARVDFLPGPSGDPCLIELELVDPNLFFRQNPSAAPQLATAIEKLLFD